MPTHWSRWARGLLGADETADWLEYHDGSGGAYRAVHLEDERLGACLFVGPRPQLPPRSWLASLFERPHLAAVERADLLAGRPADQASDVGATVCACFGVGRNQIEAAIAQGCDDPAAIGKRLKAGTNCGSCVSELRQLIAAHAAIA